MTATPRLPVLVTGGTKRLGLAIALGLGAAGFDLILHSRIEDEAASDAIHAVRATGAQVDLVLADLEDHRAVIKLASDVSARHPHLAGLVNNASVFEADALGQLTADTFVRHQQVNVLAPLLLIQGLQGVLSAANGAVVNILDHNIENPNIDFLSYKLSQFSLAGAGRILSRQLAPGIRVNGVAPGLTLPSPFQDQAAFDRIHDAVPLGRGSQPDDIAAAVVYLMTAPAVTGQILFVDGGERFLARLRDVSMDAP